MRTVRLIGRLSGECLVHILARHKNLNLKIFFKRFMLTRQLVTKYVNWFCSVYCICLGHCKVYTIINHVKVKHHKRTILEPGTQTWKIETTTMCKSLIAYLWTQFILSYAYQFLFFLFFWAFVFCRFCAVIRFFHPRHNGQWPPTSKDFPSQIVSITFSFLS